MIERRLLRAAAIADDKRGGYMLAKLLREDPHLVARLRVPDPFPVAEVVNRSLLWGR